MKIISNNKYKKTYFNKLFCLIIFFVIYSNITIANDCNIACNNKLDCIENNPQIIISCEFAGTCNSYCKYIIPNNMSYLNNFYNYNNTINNNNFKIFESNKIDINENNTSSIYGILNITKNLSNEHFLFIINDPNKILLSNINKIHFNYEPFKITKDSIIFLLKKNESVYLITYYIEPEIALKLIEKNQTFISKNNDLRTPSSLEKLKINISGNLTPKITKIIKILTIFILIAITFMFIFFIIRKNNYTKELK
jgi:hypothetical protein